MKSLQELRIELDQVQASCNKMLESTPAASWTQKNEIEFNKEMARGDAIKAEITALQKGMQNLIDPTTNHGGGDIKVLRNSKDIRAHYGAMSNSAQYGATSNGEEIRIDDFVRGVAGMKSNTAVQAALSSGTDTAGGFLLPSVVMPGILEAWSRHRPCCRLALASYRWTAAPRALPPPPSTRSRTRNGAWSRER